MEKDGRRGLFDDVIGTGFMLIGVDEQAVDDVGARTESHIAAIGGQIVHLSDAPDRTARGFRDLTGAYREWFEKNGAVAVLVRPDFYVYGIAATANDVRLALGNPSIFDLAQQLTVQRDDMSRVTAGKSPTQRPVPHRIGLS